MQRQNIRKLMLGWTTPLNVVAWVDQVSADKAGVQQMFYLDPYYFISTIIFSFQEGDAIFRNLFHGTRFQMEQVAVDKKSKYPCNKEVLS